MAGYLRVQRAAEPEDLTNEVFLGVFRGLGTFQGTQTQFRSWVFTIAHRRLQDERRRLARRPVLSTMDAELSAEEVARITGQRVGAVRALQRRALEALRRNLARKGVQL